VTRSRTDSFVDEEEHEQATRVSRVATAVTAPRGRGLRFIPALTRSQISPKVTRDAPDLLTSVRQPDEATIVS